MSPNLRRWIPRLIALGIVAGAAAGAIVFWHPWSSGPTPISFTTVAVTKGNIAAQVTANGTLSARSTVTVGAQVSGKVVELGPHSDFNSTVKKGEIIAKLDEQVLKSQIDQAAAAAQLASANVVKAQVALMDADRQYKRQKTLQDQQLIAGATLEAAEVAYQTAKAQLLANQAQETQARANLAQAKLNLSYATIVSPVDGVILSRAVELGQTVASSLQAPTLFTIAEDLASMQIDTSVGESDVGKLKDKMNATFTVDAYPGRTFNGVVRQVRNQPTTTNGVVTYDAVIDVQNTDHALKPGMTASVTFVLDQVADAVRIPNSALRFKPSREQMQAVWAELGGRPNRGSGSGSGHWRGSGGSGPPDGPPGGGPPGGGPPMGMGGGSGGRKMDFGDKKPVYKLVDGKPKMVLVKPGLTDGSSTQMVEGDLQPGDQLITEIIGAPSAGSPRKIGAF